MPVKRISDDVWERLKAWAVPLDDGVDDVLRRILDLADEHRDCQRGSKPTLARIRFDGDQPSMRLHKGKRLPEEAFKLPILETLYEQGGAGRTGKVLEIVEGKVKHLLVEVDYQPLPKSTEVRWRNTAMWERKKLVDEGLLRRDSPHGTWELSEQGIRAVESKGAS
jgi:hypothetical protein